ncbi:DUF6233 domain-containing protein [Streptomyces sp. NPDC058579]|uniref:DUF6233 domain-containing protein n=1 Tax=Streptomyces sp. NPDC058579 TaxID=3346548 RepID=UPI003663AB84
MHEELSSPELAKLQFLHRVQLQDLERTERWIGVELARLRELAARRPLPEEPGLVLSYLRKGGHPVPDSVHVGNCRLAAKHVKRLTEEQARRTIAVDGIPACEICRPDADLGILG